MPLYQPSNTLLALAPSAFGLEMLFGGAPLEPFKLEGEGKVAVVDISGPLCFVGGLFDSYDAISNRMSAAFASSAESVVMRIHSPGGDVYGAFDCARELKSMRATSGKRLVAFSAGQVCSAAYALACSADEIVIGDTAEAGSIGVILALANEAAADVAAGKSFAILASGSRKGDGNPHTPLSDAARESIQSKIDQTANVFFGLVKEMRGVDAKALEGNSFVGNAAVSAGIANRVSTWSALITQLTTVNATLKEDTMDPTKEDKDAKAKAAAEEPAKDEPTKEDATRAMLVTASESDDPVKAARAKSALAAYDADEEDSEKEKDKEAKAKAAEASAVAAASALAKQLKASTDALAALQATEQVSKDKAARTALLSGLPAAMVAALAETPTEQLAAIVASIPKSANLHVDPSPSAVRGFGDGVIRSEDTGSLDMAFGNYKPKARVERKGREMFLRPMTPEQATAHMAAMAACNTKGDIK